MATLQQDLFNAAIKNLLTGRGLNAGNIIRQVGASQAGGYFGNIAANAASSALKDVVPKSIGNSFGGFTGSVAGGAIQSLLMGGKIDPESLLKQAALKQGTKYIGNELVKAATPSMGVQTIKDMKALGGAGGGVGNILGSIASGVITKGANTKGGATGGNIGGMIGGAFGPVGSILGSILGTVVGDAFDDPLAMRKGTFKNNVDIQQGAGKGFGKVGKSAFGTFGIDDNYWMGEDMRQGLDTFITAIESIDNAFAKELNLSNDEIDKVKNALTNSEYRYKFGMEKTGFQLPERLMQDRYADALGTINPVLGDIVRFSNPPKDKIGNWLEKTMQLAKAVKSGQVSDQQLSAMREQGLNQYVGKYDVSTIHHFGKKAEIDGNVGSEFKIEFDPGSGFSGMDYANRKKLGDPYEHVKRNGVLMSGAADLDRYRNEWLQTAAGKKAIEDANNRLASLIGSGQSSGKTERRGK